jgi:probable F420-dependent oxidoreductase
MDAWTAMVYALASTTKIQVFSLVLNNDLHHPAMLAKAVATAATLSSDRVGLGIGAGWLRDDYDRLGHEFERAGTRLERLDEALTVIDRYFADDTVTFHGKYYDIDALEALPKTRRPPILVGAGGTKALTIATRHADIVGIHPRMGSGGLDASAARELTRETIQQKIDLVTLVSRSADRPTPALQFSCYDVVISGAPDPPSRPGFTDYIARHPEQFVDTPGSLRGDVAKCVEDLCRWRDELGITYWHLGGNLEAVVPIVERLSAE